MQHPLPNLPQHLLPVQLHTCLRHCSSANSSALISTILSTTYLELTIEIYLLRNSGLMVQPIKSAELPQNVKGVYSFLSKT